MSALLCLTVLLSFVYSTVAYVLLADGTQIERSLVQPNTTLLGDYIADFEFDDNISLSGLDTYMAALHCSHEYALRAHGVDVKTPRVCFRVGYTSVFIRFQGPEGQAMPAEHIVFGIVQGIIAIDQRGKLSKVTVSIFDDEKSLGTVTFEPSKKQDLLDAAKTNEVNITTSAAGVKEKEYLFYDREDGSPSNGSISIEASNLQPDDCATNTALPAQIGNAAENIKYEYTIRFYKQRGLTFQAYTMAAIQYFLHVSELRTHPNPMVDSVKVAPAFRKPGYDITVRAGYIYPVVKRTTCPVFSAYALMVAMVEIADRLLKRASKFDFFEAEISVKVDESFIPVGNLWVEEGVNDRRLDSANGIVQDGGSLTTF